MHTITITIPDDRLMKLQEIATRLGSLEEVILIGVEEVFKQSEKAFQDAVDYVLKKAELYQRLA